MRILVAIVTMLVCTSPALGQAFCALRDPVSGIFQAFPEATSYRSITRTVTSEDRVRLAETLPFTVHFNELGRHTIYLALKDRTPLGVIHVRTERGRYGLNEIGWVLGVDGRVKRMYSQRCRDPKVQAAINTLEPKIAGASVADLEAMLQTSTLDEERMLLRSGLKTLLLTWTVWSDTLLPYQAWIVANATIAGVDTVEQSDLNIEAFTNASELDVDGAAAFMVMGRQGSVLGAVVRLDWRVNDQELALWWVIDSESRILAVRDSGGQRNNTTDELLESVEGLNRTDLDSCGTATGVIASQVLDALGPINENPDA